jgi:thioesterase domain-containing protein/acyl carrier protein
MWAQALGVDRVRGTDNFFLLGGDSAAATELLLGIEHVTGARLPIGALFVAPTVADMARLIVAAEGRPLVLRAAAIRAAGSGRPFFCVGAGPLFWSLAQRLDADQPFFSLMPKAEEYGSTPRVEELAAFHVRSMRAVQPEGPYFVGGWCRDGVIAYEIVQQLRAQGEEVGLLVLFDAVNPRPWGRYAAPLVPLLRVFGLLQRGRYCLTVLRDLQRDQLLNYARERLLALVTEIKYRVSALRVRRDTRLADRLRQQQNLEEFEYLAVLHYRPKPYAGRVVLFRSTLRPSEPSRDRSLGWSRLVESGVGVVFVEGGHRSMFIEPQVASVGDTLARLLRNPETIFTIAQVATSAARRRIR